MTKIPNPFAAFLSEWTHAVGDARESIITGIDDILSTHDKAETAVPSLQELLKPYRFDEDSLFDPVWATAEEERIGIGRPDDYSWYRYDDESGRWYHGTEPSTLPEERFDYRIVGEVLLSGLYWSDWEDAGPLEDRIRKFREPAEDYLSNLPPFDVADDLTAAELREPLATYIKSCGPRVGARRLEDRSPDADHTHFVVFDGENALGHIGAVNPGRSLEAEDLEEVFDLPAPSIFLATDHYRFRSDLVDDGTPNKLDHQIRTLKYSPADCFEEIHLIGLTLTQLMGDDPFPPYFNPEQNFLEKKRYFGEE